MDTHRLRTGAWVALVMVTVTMLAGCRAYVPPPKNLITDPAQLHDAIDARIKEVRDARFKDVVLDYYGPKQRVKVRQLILVKRPDMLRVQTRLPGTDSIMSLLVTNGKTFALHKRATNQYFTGKPTLENINRLLPVDLSAADVVRVMLGGAPWDRFQHEPGKPTLRWDTHTGTYVYSARTASGGVLAMHVRPTDFAVVSVVEKSARGRVIYKYTTDGWKRVGAVVLPAYRRFVWPTRKLDFSLDVGETQVNVTLPDSLFEFPPPPGSHIVHVDG